MTVLKIMSLLKKREKESLPAKLEQEITDQEIQDIIHDQEITDLELSILELQENSTETITQE